MPTVASDPSVIAHHRVHAARRPGTASEPSDGDSSFASLLDATQSAVSPTGVPAPARSEAVDPSKRTDTQATTVFTDAAAQPASNNVTAAATDGSSEVPADPAADTQTDPAEPVIAIAALDPGTEVPSDPQAADPTNADDKVTMPGTLLTPPPATIAQQPAPLIVGMPIPPAPMDAPTPTDATTAAPVNGEFGTPAPAPTLAAPIKTLPGALLGKTPPKSGETPSGDDGNNQGSDTSAGDQIQTMPAQFDPKIKTPVTAETHTAKTEASPQAALQLAAKAETAGGDAAANAAASTPTPGSADQATQSLPLPSFNAHVSNANAAAAPNASAPVLNAVPVAGLAVEIAGQARNGNTRFAIRLDPPELGRIDVRLDVDTHGRVTSHLVVDRASTLDLLRRDAAGLERALQDAGLKTSDNGLNFSLRDQTPGQGGFEQRPGENSAQIVIPDDVATMPDLMQNQSSQLARLGGVDIRV